MHQNLPSWAKLIKKQGDACNILKYFIVCVEYKGSIHLFFLLHFYNNLIYKGKGESNVLFSAILYYCNFSK